MGKAAVGPVCLVVPCYNEASRLDVGALDALLTRPEITLLLVDDGSSDTTLRLLRDFAAAHPDRVEVVALSNNAGKGEAVRTGLCRALASGARVVGYVDADFSTPPGEVLALCDELDRSGARVVLGSRVLLLGRRITRRARRHYLGRVFATAAALVLRLPVYDTQCGAKLFRDEPALRRALAEPFVSRWAFDVELIGRLLSGPDGSRLAAEDFTEVPLQEWHDVPGSKVGMGQMIRAALDLARIAVRLRGRNDG
jgi:glycosyltransferase involved in cell wall biosynthesis